MIEKNRIYDDFLKSFRIALTNTSVYFKEHPLFVKSVDSLRKNINVLMLSVSPFRIGITPDSLVFGKEHLKGARMYEEMATFFHHRRVKAVIFSQGVNNQELISFLINANLSPKDILLKGGLSNILKEVNLRYILAEDLDYSQLLKDEGEDYSDIWLFLLRKSLKQGDSERVNVLANDFEKVLKKLRIGDLAENKEIRGSIRELFDYLKGKDADKLSRCSKELTKLVIKDGGQLDQTQTEKIKELFKNMDAKDISNALLEQLKDGKKDDSLSLNLFSKFINRDNQEGVAVFLTEKLESEEQLKNDPKVIAGIKELVTSPDFLIYESKVYHDNLAEILENITLKEGLHFNRDQVAENYRLIMLDLFVLELSSKRLGLVLAAILGELDKALGINDLKYVESFKKALDKKKEDPNSKSIFAEINKEISVFVEKAIFNEDYAFDLGFLIDVVVSSGTEVNFYLDKIFKEGKVNPYILKLFFKLFPDQLSSFCAGLDKKVSDLRFIEELMKSLVMIKPALSLEVLKHIFSSANNFVKLKVLEKIEELHIEDEGFLFSVIDKGEFLQRRGALSLLIKNPSSCSKIAQILLAIPNPFGLKSKIIKENLKLVSEVPFPEAKAYLVTLGKYRFFWNRKIRIKAKEILKKNGI